MKFSDIPYFLIKGYIDSLNQYKIISDTSMLVGNRRSIVVDGGDVQEFFIKDEDYGFKPITMKPYFSDIVDSGKFNFTKYSKKEYSDTLLWDISDTYHTVKIYELSDTVIDSVTNGQEIYFRKDSPFYEWLSNYAASLMEDEYAVEFVIRNYINTDKSFIYFGTIYKNRISGDDGYHIIHYNIQNFVLDSIPYHQRTDKLKDFIFLNFDVLYNEIYNSLKDIPNLIDPTEVKSDYLQYIADYFNIDVDSYNISDQAKRHLVSEAVNIIKAKGTYNIYPILWRILTDNTTNRLNIYDRWHYKDLYDSPQQEIVTQQREISTLGFSDVIFPKTFQSISDNDLDYDDGVAYIKDAEIVEQKSSDSTWTITSRNDDLFKYGYSVSQVRDENGIIIYPESLVSINEKFLEIDPVNEVHSKEVDLRISLSSPQSVNGKYHYTVQHDLESNVLVSVFDGDSQSQIVSDELIKIDDNNIKIITDDELTEGYANIIKVAQTHNFNDYYVEISHNLNTYSVMVDSYSNNKKIIPKKITIVDKNTITVLFSETVKGQIYIGQGSEIYEGSVISLYDDSFNLVSPKRLYENSSTGYYVATFPVSASGHACINPPLLEVNITDESEVWEIQHDLDSIQLIVQVRDGTDYITPKNIEFVDYNNIKITFPIKQTGTAIIGRGFESNEDKYSISDNAWIDYLYTNLYNYTCSIEGAGDVFYDRYYSNSYPEKFDEKILSTNYLLQPDLTNTPLESDSIVSSNMSDTLYDFWESFRPINRVAHYNYLISPTTDLSGRWNYLYPSIDSDAYMKSKSVNFSLSFTNTYVGIMGSSSTWTVNHNLGSKNVLIQCLNTDLEEIVPENIQSTTKDRLVITFGEEISGYALVKKSEFVNDVFTADYTITIVNDWDQTELLTQVRNSSDEVIIPSELQLTGEGNVTIDVNGDVYTKKPEKTIYLNSNNVTTNHDGGEYIYYVYHWLNELSLLSNVYNNNNKKIHPKSIERMDNNTIKITNTENIDNGYIVIDNAWATATFHTKKDNDENLKYWDIKHNLDSTDLLVQVVNLDNNIIIPNEIEFINSNEIRLTMNKEADGTVLITRGWEEIKTTEQYKIKHSQTQKEVITQFRDTDYNVIYSNVELIDSNYIGTNIGEGIVSFYEPEKIILQTTASDKWEIFHELDNSGIIFAVYNSDNERVIPDSFTIDNSNNFTLTFSEAISGYVVVTKVGRVLFHNILGSAKFGISNSQDNLSTISYINDVTDFFEDGNYYYVRLDIPTGADYSIKSIGIINSDTDDLIFYSECSEIYKKSEFSATIFYRISKERI